VGREELQRMYPVMKYEVKQYNYDNLPAEIKGKDYLLSNSGCGEKYAYYLVISHNGEILRVESDPMEPEDAIFPRDLYWIKLELERAYRLGYEDAMGDLEKQ
jgi:hypothetical protein